MELAVALGSTAAWGQPFANRSSVPWHERRDLYPEGVASGDSDSDSVMLWTPRRPSSAARGPTAALSCIVRDIEPASGARVKDLS